MLSLIWIFFSIVCMCCVCLVWFEKIVLLLRYDYVIGWMCRCCSWFKVLLCVILKLSGLILIWLVINSLFKCDCSKLNCVGLKFEILKCFILLILCSLENVFVILLVFISIFGWWISKILILLIFKCLSEWLIDW